MRNFAPLQVFTCSGTSGRFVGDRSSFHSWVGATREAIAPSRLFSSSPRFPLPVRAAVFTFIPMVRLVLFDIDGTLVRTSGAGVKAFAKVFATEFNAVDGFERLKFSGRTDISLVREFFGYHEIPATRQNFERFFERYVFWLDHILKESKSMVCEGAWDFIRGLQSMQEKPLPGILTGNIRLGAEIKLRHLHLWDVFQTGAFADDHEDRARIAAKAVERGSRVLNEDLGGEQVVVIGDTPLDIACARAVGAKVIAVATGTFELEELQAHQPDWAAQNLGELDPREVVLGDTVEKS